MYKLYKIIWISSLALFIYLTGFSIFSPNVSAVEATQSQASGIKQIAVIPELANGVNISIPDPAPKPQISNMGLSLNIPAINLDIPLGTTALDSQKHLMVPADPNKAAWYVKGPKPGNRGTALVTGHYDSSAGPGVFYDLEQLRANDQIKITREDGSVAVFAVEKLESYKQDHTFPWKKVYSENSPASLRIITCDGEYNPTTGKYSHNLVVYAGLVGVE